MKAMYWGLALCVALLATTVGCDSNSAPQSEQPIAAALELPAGLFVDAAPQGARSVGELIADEDARGDVVVAGRIGGRKQAFVDGAAVFLLADAGMQSCNELHGDGCPTPWDYCCEPKESLSAKVLTVQIVGDDGKPLKLDVAGSKGLDPLAKLTIAGEVARRGEGGVVVINARHIYIEPDRG